MFPAFSQHEKAPVESQAGLPDLLRNGLNLQIKPCKLLNRDKPDALAMPEVPNITWSMDVMADRPREGLAFSRRQFWTTSSAKVWASSSIS